MKGYIRCLLLVCCLCTCINSADSIYVCTSSTCGDCKKFLIGFDIGLGNFAICIECNKGNAQKEKKVQSSKINEENTLGDEGCSTGVALLIVGIIGLVFCCVAAILLIFVIKACKGR